MTLPLALRFFHILSAALWMGSGLFWPGSLRRALALGPPHPAPAFAQARVGLGLDLGSGVATVVTGLLYASPLGGVTMRLAVGGTYQVDPRFAVGAELGINPYFGEADTTNFFIGVGGAMKL